MCTVEPVPLHVLTIFSTHFYQEELYVLSEASLKFALLDPHLLHTISMYYEQWSLLNPIISNSSSYISVASGVVKTEGVYADSGDVMDYSADTVTVTSRASASSTDTRGTSSLSTNRTTTKAGGTTLRTNNPSTLSDTSNTNTISTSTNISSPNTATTAAGRKRGRPSILEKAIAQSFETCMSGGFYNSPPPVTIDNDTTTVYTSASPSARIGSNASKSGAKSSGTATTTTSNTTTTTAVLTNNDTGSTSGSARSKSVASKAAGDAVRGTKQKATKEARGDRTSGALAGKNTVHSLCSGYCEVCI